MSYSTVRAALHDVFRTVEPKIAVTLPYEPTALHDFPTLYTLFNTADRNANGPVTTMNYSVVARLCFRWQDNEQAELETEPFINALPAAIDANAGLSGVLTSGIARVTNVLGVFVSIGGVVYRAIDFTIEVIEKAPRLSGI